MDIIKTGSALVLALAIAGCASTTDSVRPDTAAEAETASATDEATGADSLKAENDVADPDKVICKRMTKLGTRVPSRVCATRAEWEAVQREAQRNTEDLQRRPQQGRETG